MQITVMVEKIATLAERPTLLAQIETYREEAVLHRNLTRFYICNYRYTKIDSRVVQYFRNNPDADPTTVRLEDYE